MALLTIAGCVLAGGRSQRMGRDKRMELLGGRMLLDHAIDRLRPHVGCLMINANDDAIAYEAYGLPVRPDPIAGFAGPLAGLLAALIWAVETRAECVVTVAADTPFFPTDLVRELLAASDGQISCASSGGRLHPVFSLWRRPQQFVSPLEHVLEDEGLRKVESFVTRYRHNVVDWPTAPYDPFFNINTPDDLAEAGRILAEFAP